jgi:DNA polymerase zeta
MMFVKPEIRKSLLAKMLSELLDTRVMVKSSMKAVQQDRVRPFSSSRAYTILIEGFACAGFDETAQRAATSPEVSRERGCLPSAVRSTFFRAQREVPQVTYGYTSATFSGRMPAVEIADAIVQTGRETLERVSTTVLFEC